MLSSTGLTELGATYKNEAKLDRLMQALTRSCEGILPTPSEEMIRLEAEQGNVYDVVTGRSLLSVGDLEARIAEAVKDENVKKFFEEGAFGNKEMKHLLDALDPLRKKLKDKLGSFVEYERARRIAALKAFMTVSHERGRIPKVPDDLETLEGSCGLADRDPI